MASQLHAMQFINLSTSCVIDRPTYQLRAVWSSNLPTSCAARSINLPTSCVLHDWSIYLPHDPSTYLPAACCAKQQLLL